MIRTGKTVICLLLIAAACGRLAADAPAPSIVEVKHVAVPPALDGVLDDECWEDAIEYTSFTSTSTKELMAIQTIVKICHDEENVYVAFRALHPEPDKIPAKETKRNGRWRTDDCVWVCIDSTHAHRGFSSFIVNARGTQFDSLEGGSAAKIQWRGDWRTGATVVNDGYNVEMAIPFSLLKFNKNQDTFGICFERWLPKESKWSSWPDMKGSWETAKFAHWEGVDPPFARPRPVVMGYLASATGGESDSDHRAGVDLKYPFRNNMLGLISIRPDFDSIEQEVESVDFSYTERLLPDYRPFFQEWRVGGPPPLFYSRRIEDFDVGTKVAGRQGPHSFGFMNARDIGVRRDSVAQYTRNIGDRSGVSICATDHRMPGHRNSAALYTGWIGWANGDRKHNLGGGVYTSSTTDLPAGQYKDIHYDTWSGNGKLGGSFRLAQIDPTFNAELGLVPDVDTRGYAGDINWSKMYTDKKIHYVRIAINKRRWDHVDGSPFLSGTRLVGNMDLANGQGVSFSLEKADRDEFRDFTSRIGLSWNRNSFDRDGGVGYAWGRRAGGSYTGLSISQKFRLRDDLLLAHSYERSSISQPSPHAEVRRQFITTLNYDLTSEKSIGGRVVQRLGKRNVYLVYRQQVRRGMDVYIIYGDPNAEESTGRISVKLVQPLY